MSITPLGSGQEVGRSCHLLTFRDMTILLDCGIHPGYDGINGLPFFDRVEPDQVDAVLITHFHLDHAASLPYFTERTGFKGRVFMTHPTKAVIRLLLGDYLRLMSMKGDSGGDKEVLYTEKDLEKCVEKIELIDYHQSIRLKSMTFHALNAGHVLGAAMFLISIGGRTILYTGDYSMEDDRHLTAAEIPSVKPDVLIVESTYGVQVHASRREREARFTGTVERVVSQGGRCLIPVFALGRAQELLLILDEYWGSRPQLRHVPIWYASKLASRALRVYQTYANMMNARIRAQMDISNPFSFKYISNLKGIDVDSFDDRGPSVVFASPGMLQSGVSRQLFDRWCTDPKNGVLIAGYAVENTLAREIMNQPNEVVSLEGRRQPLNCLVDYVSFSAHVDFVQNRDFIGKVEPRHIILVHGQKDEMGRLKSALMLRYKQLPESKRPSVIMPPNTQEVTLKFTRRRNAKVVGSLAERSVSEGTAVEGILVTQNFSSKVVSPDEVAAYTPLRVGSVGSTLHVPFRGKIQVLQLFLEQMFAAVTTTIIKQEYDASDDATMTEAETEKQPPTSSLSTSSSDSNIVEFTLSEGVDKVVIRAGDTDGMVSVQWEASPVGDVLADAVVALLMQAQSSTASIRLSGRPCRHGRRAPETADEQQQQPPPNKKGRMEDVDDDAAAKEGDNRNENVMGVLHSVLREQYERVELEWTDGENKELGGSFTITADSGVETEEGGLVCTASVTFDENSNDAAAKIAVECEDSKLATNVRDCLVSVATASAPLGI